MRQILILLSVAMGAAFSMSWATPEVALPSNTYLLPNKVQVLAKVGSGNRSQFIAKVSLREGCEKIESSHQELRGRKLIFSLRARQLPKRACDSNPKQAIEIKLPLEWHGVLTDTFEIYFRNDEVDLKYFGKFSLQDRRMDKFARVVFQ